MRERDDEGPSLRRDTNDMFNVLFYVACVVAYPLELVIRRNRGRRSVRAGVMIGGLLLLLGMPAFVAPKTGPAVWANWQLWPVYAWGALVLLKSACVAQRRWAIYSYYDGDPPLIHRLGFVKARKLEPFLFGLLGGLVYHALPALGIDLLVCSLGLFVKLGFIEQAEHGMDEQMQDAAILARGAAGHLQQQPADDVPLVVSIVASPPIITPAPPPPETLNPTRPFPDP